MRIEPFDDAELTINAFLGGRAQIAQPTDGYRAGTDPVLLAASIPATPGQSVLELGCGGGVGLVLLGTRVPGLDLAGVELQPGYADLARRNTVQNACPAEIYCADLASLPPPLRARRFDHVMANPPYFEASRRTMATAQDRELALAGGTPLEAWVTAAARRLAPGGYATFIQSAERLPELLTAMQSCLGSLVVWPVQGRPDRAPKLVLVRGRKSGRAAFRLHAPLVLHAGPSGADYRPQIEAVMRQAAPLPFPI